MFLEITPAEVMDTATFYEEYWLKPKGQYLLQVCRSLSCEICQSGDLTRHLVKKLGIEQGETTSDGRFTLVELECLGACGTSPVMLINDVLHEELTVPMVDNSSTACLKSPRLSRPSDHLGHAWPLSQWRLPVSQISLLAEMSKATGPIIIAILILGGGFGGFGGNTLIPIIW